MSTQHIPPDSEMSAQQESSVRTNRSAAFRSKASWLIYFAIILSIAVLVLIGLMNVPHQHLPALLSRTRQATNIGAILQACFAIWIVLRWPRVIAWCRVKRILRKNEHRKALQLRNKAAATFALYLLLIPIGPMALVRAAERLFY